VWYKAWKTGKPVRFLYRGASINATPDTIIGQLVAEYRAAKGKGSGNA
jgi:hypothetical protein